MSGERPRMVWAVTRGEYSDYCVLCVCDSRERAEQAAAVNNEDTSEYNASRVEPFLYLDHDPEKVTLYEVSINIWDDGTMSEDGPGRRAVRVRSVDPAVSTRAEWEFDMLYPERQRPVSWRWVRAPCHNGAGGRLEVYGTDLERVRKTFSDKRAAYLADDVLRSRKEAHS